MFQEPVDIANRALQHCGASLITALTDDDKGASQISQCYDDLRRAELRRNVWSFAVKKAVLYPINTMVSGLQPPTITTSTPTAPATVTSSLPTMLLVPPTWSATASYAFGAIVAYGDDVWVSLAQSNVGNTPGATGVTQWDTYFGSMCVQPYDSGKNYFVGDLVYEQTGGEINVYVSLENGNNTDPQDAIAWSATTTYGDDQVVQDAQGYFWQSTMNMNTGNQPGVYGFWSSTATYAIGDMVIASDNQLYQALVSTTNVNPANAANPADWKALGYPGSWPMWNSTTTYAKGTIVAGTDGQLYQSLQGSNLNRQPVGSSYNPNTPATNWWMGLRLPNPWIANFGTTTAGTSWLGLGASVTPLNINYPLGTGPSIQTETRNIFKLPHGFLRIAPQDPKRGSTSFLGAPSGLMYKDWEIDGEYLISHVPYPIVLRFIGDVTQVTRMDDMFCEGLAVRVALAICEPLTQSATKITTIVSEYKKFMDEARTVNGIEQGATEPPEDDYITCRI